MENQQLKVRVNWSYYQLPGFEKARNGKGFVPHEQDLLDKNQAIA